MENCIAAVFNYFQEIGEVKSLLSSMQMDIKKLAGEDASVLVTTRRGRTIGNTMCKNSELCEPDDMKCTNKRCKTCPLLLEPG